MKASATDAVHSLWPVSTHIQETQGRNFESDSYKYLQQGSFYLFGNN